MKEIWSGRKGRYWFCMTRRTHGVILGVSIHWPSRKWNQWQVGALILDVRFGRDEAQNSSE